MIDRLRKPSPGMLMLAVLVLAAMSTMALVISIVSLNAAVDNASRKATRDALCAVWIYQIPEAGEPQPQTERGKAQAAKALEQYRALGCEPDR